MTFTVMCIFNFFYWIHDIVSSVKMNHLDKCKDDVIAATTNFIKLFFFFIPTKLVWVYTSLKAMDYLKACGKFPWAETIFTLLGFFECVYCLILILFFIFYSIGFFGTYLSSLKHGVKCSFKFFRKIYLISDFTSDDANIIYEDNNHYKRIHFSFLSHIFACFLLNRKYNRFKGEEIDKEQGKFYEMVIKDLQEKQAKNEEKAREYLSRVQKNEEDILDNFHKTLELQKKRK